MKRLAPRSRTDWPVPGESWISPCTVIDDPGTASFHLHMPANQDSGDSGPLLQRPPAISDPDLEDLIAQWREGACESRFGPSDLDSPTHSRAKENAGVSRRSLVTKTLPDYSNSSVCSKPGASRMWWTQMPPLPSGETHVSSNTPLRMRTPIGASPAISICPERTLAIEDDDALL